MAAKSLDGGAGRRAACASNDSRPETPCWASRVSDAGVVAAANRWRSGWAAAAVGIAQCGVQAVKRVRVEDFIWWQRLAGAILERRDQDIRAAGGVVKDQTQGPTGQAAPIGHLQVHRVSGVDVRRQNHLMLAAAREGVTLGRDFEARI